MPTPIFEPYSPGIKEDINSRMKNLSNAYTETTNYLTWILQHLDEGNVIRAKSVVTDWVYAGNVATDQLTAGSALIGSALIESITTDQITAGVALISSALIESLVVGTNVSQGTAPIVFYSTPTTPYRVNDIWVNGTDLKRCSTARATGDYVAGDWELGTNYQNPTGVTSIVGGVVTTDYVNALNVTAYSVNALWVYAGNINASQITAGTISADMISGGTLSGVTLDIDTDATVGDNIYLGGATGLSLRNDGVYGGFTMYSYNTLLLRFYNNALFCYGGLGVEAGENIGAVSGTTWYNGFEMWSDRIEFNTDVIFNHDLDHDGSYISFFNGSLSTKQSVTDPSAITTAETADSTYSSNEVDMLNHLKTDVTNLKNKLTDLVNALQAYNLV